MKITRRSPLTGQINTMDLPITEEQAKLWNSPSRPLIQDIFPNLTPAEREFIQTGYTQADWDAMFPPHGEEAMKAGNMWIEFGENYWAAEMSTVSEGGRVEPKCPKCSKPTGPLAPTRLDDGEITKWEGFHDCGAHLLIWND